MRAALLCALALASAAARLTLASRAAAFLTPAGARAAAAAALAAAARELEGALPPATASALGFQVTISPRVRSASLALSSAELACDAHPFGVDLSARAVLDVSATYRVDTPPAAGTGPLEGACTATVGAVLTARVALGVRRGRVVPAARSPPSAAVDPVAAACDGPLGPLVDLLARDVFPRHVAKAVGAALEAAAAGALAAAAARARGAPTKIPLGELHGANVTLDASARGAVAAAAGCGALAVRLSGAAALGGGGAPPRPPAPASLAPPPLALSSFDAAVALSDASLATFGAAAARAAPRAPFSPALVPGWPRALTAGDVAALTATPAIARRWGAGARVDLTVGFRGAVGVRAAAGALALTLPLSLDARAPPAAGRAQGELVFRIACAPAAAAAPFVAAAAGAPPALAFSVSVPPHGCAAAAAAGAAGPLGDARALIAAFKLAVEAVVLPEAARAAGRARWRIGGGVAAAEAWVEAGRAGLAANWTRGA